MIFVANGADFSKNNLGHVSVKLPNEVSEKTKSILAFYGDNYTDDEKIALDDFVEIINKYSSKIKYAYLPILGKKDTSVKTRAQITSQYLYNIASDAQANIVSTKSNTYEFDSTRKLYMGENGLMTTWTVNYNLAPLLQLVDTLNTTDFFIMMAGAFPTSYSNNAASIITLYDKQFGIFETDASISWQLSYATSTQKTVIGISNNSSLSLFSTNEEVRTQGKNSRSKTIGYISIGPYNDGNPSSEQTVSAIIAGLGLSESEYREINSVLINTINILWRE